MQSHSRLINIALRVLVVLMLCSAGTLQAQQSDSQLRERLSEIYQSLDGLQPVTAEVSAGVVILRGEVLSEEARIRAADLAAELDGVVEVENRIEVTADVVKRIGPAMERLQERLLRVAYNLPLLGVGILILFLAWWFARWLSGRDLLYRRIQQNPFLRDIVAQMIKAAILVAAALFVLDLLGLTAMVGAVLGAAGVATLAIGFAFRDLIENYIASVLLSLRQPFEPDDLVRIGEHEGRVSRLTSRATILITLEGNHVRIPNATVFKSVMINFTRNPRRRFSFDLGVDVEQPLPRAQSLAEDTVAGVSGVLTDPRPVCVVEQLGDSNVLLRVLAWVDQRGHDFARVRSEAIRNTKEAFDTAGIVMPEPIYNIKMLDKKPAAGAVPGSEKPSASTASDRPAGADTRERDEIQETVRQEMVDGENLLSDKGARE